MSCFRLQTYYLRPVRDDFRSVWTDLRLVMADCISELAEFRPEWANFRPQKLTSSLIRLISVLVGLILGFRSQISVLSKLHLGFGQGGMYEWTDRRMYGHMEIHPFVVKVICRLRPLPKK